MCGVFRTMVENHVRSAVMRLAHALLLVPLGASVAGPFGGTASAANETTQPIRSFIELTSTTVTSSSAQTAPAQKDLPRIVRETADSAVLVVVMNSAGQQIRQGSGFVASADGKIVTNYHVIEGASSAVVKFPTGAFFNVEGLLGTNAIKDLAVLKLAARALVPLAIGDSDLVQVGDPVVAIGSPLALEATVSNGIISAIRVSDADGGLKLLQTTAPVSPGSSGGALLNMRSEVIGITTLQVSGQNLNFAVPINEVVPLLADGPVRSLSTATIRIERESAGSSTLGDLEGTYVGAWQSNLGYSGVAALTVIVSGSTDLKSKVVLTGSPVGYKGDSVRLTVTKLGEGVWTVEFRGDRTNLSGTGVFRGRSFIGDYRYVRVLLGVDDRGQWILKR